MIEQALAYLRAHLGAANRFEDDAEGVVFDRPVQRAPLPLIPLLDCRRVATLDAFAEYVRVNPDKLWKKGIGEKGPWFWVHVESPSRVVYVGPPNANREREIPLVAERQGCEKLADAALDAALLLTTAASDPREPDRVAFSDPEIESALSQIPWRVRQQDTGVFQIDAAPAPGHAMRVMLVAQGAALRA